MKRLFRILVLVVFLASEAQGQDLGWLVEQAPVVSMILVKALDKSPSFSAQVEVQATSKSDPVPSAASGTLELQNHNMRWEARLADVTSSQLTGNTRSLVRQINGDRFLLLTRPDQQSSFLILSGAHACLESRLPTPASFSKVTQLGQETIDGHACLKERMVVKLTEGTTNEVLIWRAKELKNNPIRIEVSNSSERFSIQLKGVQFRTIRPERFQVPEGIARYNSVEDLVQSVLLEKMKKRMGLQ